VAGAASADRVRTAEVVAALSLATDLGMGFPLEHSLRSTLVALRLADRLGVDDATLGQTYYGSPLVHIGCTADAEVAAALFEEGAALTHFVPVAFGSMVDVMAGVARGLGGSGGPAALRAVRGVARLPRAARGLRHHQAAMCDVGRMLTDRLGLPDSVSGMFGHLTERWDGRGQPDGLRGEQLPMALRIIHVATDAAIQRFAGGDDQAVRVVRKRAGHAFDPEVATMFADHAGELLAAEDGQSAWDDVLAREPAPHLVLTGDALDGALAAIGEFSDLLSPFLVGHAAGVADLAAAAAQRGGLTEREVAGVRRAASVHDLGRVAIAAHIWQKPGALTPDEWERVRLHPYYTERVLARSPLLSALAQTAGCHHERFDGTGYHRGLAAPNLSASARLVAAADAYHAMTEPRPHRRELAPQDAADVLAAHARAGRLCPDAVAAVLGVAGQPTPPPVRPAGLTEREVEVVALLARGRQTKQIARALGISPKTADRHIQNAYAKMGISTRAAAALFAMRHGLMAWGEFPIDPPDPRS
jgi:HD-GYP domain-containing protein (c-di-GMP phosphodiesterase class II)